MANVVAAAGAVVVEQPQPGRNSFRYKKKCEHCGWIDGSTSMGHAGNGSKLYSSFHCPKCKEHQPVELLF